MVPEVPVFGSNGAMLLWLAVTVIMPLVVGLVTKFSTSAAVKSLLLVLLSLVNGVLSEALAAGDGFDWRKAITQAVVAFVIAVAVHFGVWKPTGTTDTVQRVGDRQAVHRAP
jgi:hypothetical protein